MVAQSLPVIETELNPDIVADLPAHWDGIVDDLHEYLDRHLRVAWEPNDPDRTMTGGLVPVWWQPDAVIVQVGAGQTRAEMAIPDKHATHGMTLVAHGPFLSHGRTLIEFEIV